MARMCADHALDHPEMLEEPRENQHIPQIYEHDQQYRWNVEVPTPAAQPWIGFNVIHSILSEMQVVHSPDFIQANSAEVYLQRGQEVHNQLINLVPGIFLNSFRILSPEEEGQWPNIVWDFQCFVNGLNVTSHGGNHKISFDWNIEELYDEDALLCFKLITVEYTGPFQLQEIPQY
jgi:hypothetical protein